MALKNKPRGRDVFIITATSLFLVLVILFILTDRGIGRRRTVDLAAQDADARSRAAASDPYSSFRSVTNTCGLCGTDHPYGGWETEDGSILALSRDSSFVAVNADKTSMRGDWTIRRDELCLKSAGGDETCYSHEQRVDAMLLDGVIYIRQ